MLSASAPITNKRKCFWKKEDDMHTYSLERIYVYGRGHDPPYTHRNISMHHPIGKNALKAILSLWIESGQRNGTKVPDSFCFHWPGLYSRYKGRDTCICFTLLKKRNEVIRLEILTKANAL